jgi:hypothetical protein
MLHNRRRERSRSSPFTDTCANGEVDAGFRPEGAIHDDAAERLRRGGKGYFDPVLANGGDAPIAAVHVTTEELPDSTPERKFDLRPVCAISR